MKSPTPAQVRKARAAEQMTQAQAAELVGLGDAKRWGEIERGVYPMHPGLWELFQIKCGKHPEYAPAWMRAIKPAKTA